MLDSILSPRDLRRLLRTSGRTREQRRYAECFLEVQFYIDLLLQLAPGAVLPEFLVRQRLRYLSLSARRPALVQIDTQKNSCAHQVATRAA